MKMTREDREVSMTHSLKLAKKYIEAAKLLVPIVKEVI